MAVTSLKCYGFGDSQEATDKSVTWREAETLNQRQKLFAYSKCSSYNWMLAMIRIIDCFFSSEISNENIVNGDSTNPEVLKDLLLESVFNKKPLHSENFLKQNFLCEKKNLYYFEWYLFNESVAEIYVQCVCVCVFTSSAKEIPF